MRRKKEADSVCRIELGTWSCHALDSDYQSIAEKQCSHTGSHRACFAAVATGISGLYSDRLSRLRSPLLPESKISISLPAGPASPDSLAFNPGNSADTANN